MKINNRKVFQAIQFAVFLGVSIFLFFRKVNGSGAENTSDVKLISFAVWLGFYLFALALEYGIRFLAAIIKKGNKDLKLIAANKIMLFNIEQIFC
ncbi:MAG: DUF3923 family protein [Clostridiales bacterium]|nr:DUF3923 family protein [Clostridiales bacterium]